MKKTLVVLLCALLCTGCAGRPASRTEGILKDIKDLASAEAIFGPAATKAGDGGGGTRAVWAFSRVFQAPARVEERDVFVGYDRDGYPVYRTVSIYIPPHGELQQCRIDIAAGPDGRILQASSQGNSCDLLLTPQGREALAESPR